MLIGVSKRSCLACFLYIDRFNQKLNKKWKTSGCHGKPYEKWVLPKHYQEVGAAVIKDIEGRLQSVLDQLTRHTQYSDDYASSQDEGLLKMMTEMSLRDALLPFPVPRAEMIKFVNNIKPSKLKPTATPMLQTQTPICQEKINDTWYARVLIRGTKGYHYWVEISQDKKFSVKKELVFFEIGERDPDGKIWDGNKILLKLQECVSNAYYQE